ncbi:phosphopantetheine-binding protein [Streptomyces sp. TRM43335]|uniref:Phosphopantetheine-binding protein n=1 Tax=Streptomyces taklimakanensis TaxID=2569853 RepID=A0A6G2BJQ7_9ACTN|nr:phosphopantetheine-binding protein [Streptomyces taklimakanensis]
MTNSVEQVVTRIWTDVLRPDPGRENLSFFELSGQSVSAMRIVARVESELGVEVDISVLFDDPDLDAFVRAVAESAGDRAGEAA